MNKLPKLFAPGPIDIAPETYEAMNDTSIGHRGSDFEELYANLQVGLQKVARTTRPVYLCTSSAWGIMEGALRNLTQKKVLNLCGGAFSDKWYGVAKSCGKEAEKIQVEWGEVIDPEAVRTKLNEGGFDTVTLCHSETSTGALNPLAEIAAVVNDFPDVLLIVDTVSSFSALPIDPETPGIDVLLCGVQKALALPPGLALFTASDRALARAATTLDRGYYFDFVEFQKNHEKNNTPSTPAIPHLRALQERVNVMLAEGLDARYARHAKTNAMIHDWAASHGIKCLPPEGYHTPTLNCFVTPDTLDLKKFMAELRSKHNLLINGGYGKIKGETFRISNMGNETEETIQELINALNDVFPHCQK